MKKLVMLGTMAVVLAVAGSALSAPIVFNTWSGATTENWGIAGASGFPGSQGQGAPVDGAYGSIAQNTILGNGALEITGGGISAVEEDFISADATANALYTGNYITKNVKSIKFEFYDGEGLAAAADLRLYFHSTSGITWFYDIDNTGVNTWNSYYANFSPTAAGSWYDETATGTWITDITTVDEVGIYISYLDGIPSQQYAIGRFELNDKEVEGPVPEPETYAMLGFAMVGLCVTFRRRIEDSLQGVLQTIRG